MDSLRVVGVHGIWQGNTNSEKLAAEWRGALTRGMSRHFGADIPIPALTVRHYAEEFRRRKGTLGPGADAFDDQPIDADEEAFIAEALTEVVPQAPAAAPQQVGTLGMGLPYLPLRVTRLMAGIDATCGRHAGKRLLYTVRQVYKYLYKGDIGARIRDVVREDLTQPGTRVTIAHSLGSVVVYDLFHRGELGPASCDVNTLITCGSPLGWPTVRRAVNGLERPLSVPEGVEWVNVYSLGDLVALGQGLAGVALKVRDEEVSNGTAPHEVTRYLDKRPVSESVVRALAV